jgi:FSR family fosmidomycin resistance protein-like MFS transporter
VDSNTRRRLYPIALSHFAIELCHAYLPIVYPILITTMGLTYAQVGFAALVSGVGTTVSQPLFGYLSDRWGSRPLIITGIAWTGLVMGLVGLAGSYWLLLVLIGLGALGSAAFHPAGMSVAGSVAAERRGAALSVFSVGGSLGSALSPLLLAMAISRWGLSGTLVLIPVGLLIAFVVYRQLGWGRGARPSPTSTGPIASENQRPAPTGALLALVVVIITVQCRSWVYFSLVTYLPEWLRSQGWSLERSSQMLTTLVVCVALGALLGGPLSDRIGRWQVLALTLGLLSPAVWFFLTTTGAIQWALVGLIGISIGGSFPVSIAAAQEVWPHRVGMASALVSGLGWLPGGIGAAFTGFVADRTSLTTALTLLVIPPVLGLICVLVYVGSQSLRKRQVEPQQLRG